MFKSIIVCMSRIEVLFILGCGEGTIHYKTSSAPDGRVLTVSQHAER
jgi:hypothetical protein